jgi:hypothetical protein
MIHAKRLPNRVLREVAVSAACFALVAALTGASASPASADDSALAAMQALAAGPNVSVLSDAQMSVIRGRYVPQGASLAISASTASILSPVGPASVGASSQPDGSAGASPLGSIVNNGVTAGFGQVVYFGVQMVSQWQTGSGTDLNSAQVGAALGINLQNGTMTQGTWSQSQGAGLAAIPPATDSVNGGGLTNISSGIGQSIQVAGNANSVANQTDIAISTAAPAALMIPVLNTCGAPCSAVIDPNTMSVAITQPGGVVSQTINANGILQSARIAGDVNQIMNTMHVQVQVAPSAGLNAAQLTSLLQTAQALLH